MKKSKRAMAVLLSVLIILIAFSQPISTRAASGKVSFSVSGVSMVVGDQKTITVSHVYGKSCYYSYRTSGNSNNSLANLKWGSWNRSGTACPLTINANKSGSFKLQVILYDAGSKQAIASTNIITVNIVNPSITLGTGDTNINAGSSKTIQVSHVYNRSCYYSYETSGNNGYADLKWGSWNSAGTACPITITGKNAGSFKLRVKLYDSTTKQLRATTNWITLSIVKKISVTYSTYYVTTTEGLILRSGRGTWYSKILTMPYQSAISVESGSISGGWAKVIYNGKTGYCSTSYISRTKPVATISLNVPVYRQYDSNWSKVKIGTKTIGHIGCTTTCVAMKYSYQTGKRVTPDKMKNKLSYSGNNMNWSSVSRLGYTVTKAYNTKINQSIMKTIYTQLKNGKPVIVGGIPSASSSSQHWIIVTGYKGSSTTFFKASDFTIIDPNSSSRKNLSAFLDYKPYVYRLVY